MKDKSFTIKSYFIVNNDKGIHTRPATEIVKCSVKYKSKIQLSNQGHTVNAKSLLGILILAATKGTKIEITAIGEDAQEAVDAILKLASTNFNIQY